MDYNDHFNQNKESRLSGRYIPLSRIEPLLPRNVGGLSIAGQSIRQRPIYTLTLGKGKTRILIWSQMHGNETTATKALFDFFNFLERKGELSESFLERFTFCIVPMLNPDGSENYTRENAAGADLNRDFTQLTQPESQCLFSLFQNFKPDYCFNLHDQRTIFAVGDTGKPATLSFLAPAFNENRDWNTVRGRAAAIINAMNTVLQREIPGQVGRFDDSFNINCVGDRFQSEGVPTILFEAGHYQNDYQRETCRRYFFTALLAGLHAINENVVVDTEIAEYLHIPQNKMVFYDFVYKNIRINYDGNELITNFASQYQEALVDGQIVFNAVISTVGNLEGFRGHTEYDARGAVFKSETGSCPRLGVVADFHLGDIEFSNGAPVA